MTWLKVFSLVFLIKAVFQKTFLARGLSSVFLIMSGRKCASPRKVLLNRNLKIIPSFEYSRLQNKLFTAYIASAELMPDTYTLSFLDINTRLSISYNAQLTVT